MGAHHLSEQVLLVIVPRHSRDGRDLEIATDMANPQEGRHVIVDFSHIEILTSGLLSQLMILERQLDALDKKLVLCCVPVEIMNLFKCVGLQSLFHFAEDQDAALKSLGVVYCAPS